MRTLHGFLALLCACGSNGSGDDAAVPDGHLVDGYNADGSPAATRAMTLAVTDVTLTSPDAVAAGMKGAIISIQFDDLTQGGGRVVYGTDPDNGCVVTQYTVGIDTPHPTVGAGEIDITPPATGSNGLKKPVGPCTYENGSYACVSYANNAPNESISGAAAGVQDIVTYAMANRNLTGDLVGSYYGVNGFTTQATLNTGAGLVPILAQPDAHTLTTIHAGATGTDTTTGGTFAVINGAGPIPTQPGNRNATFLGDDTNFVEIKKVDDANWPGFDDTLPVGGDGLHLDSTSAHPELFPSVAQDVTFSCSGSGGSCGAFPTLPAGGVWALIVTGTTTDADVSSTADDFDMPPATGSYAEFACRFPIVGNTVSGTIPSDAVAQILASHPSRVATRVYVAAVMPTTNGLDSGSVVLGHGLIGHSSFPQ